LKLSLHARQGHVIDYARFSSDQSKGKEIS
jgi:hypothetical protein